MRTVLFFGDSNTRGYGCGRDHRYAAHVEAALAPVAGDRWRFVVSAAESDFRAIRDRLYRSVAKYEPDLLVWQCPTGPAAYFVQYPPWLTPIRDVYNRMFQRRRERAIRNAQAVADESRSSRYDVMYDGEYLDDLYRWRPAAWPVARHANRWLAARYGLRVKATRERYLEVMTGHRDRLLAETSVRQIVFVGFIPHSDDFYPGFHDRVTAWGPDLVALLHRPEFATVYVDPYVTLAAGSGRHLLRDGAHLTPEGHRILAAIVAPVLLDRMRLLNDAMKPSRTVQSA